MTRESVVHDQGLLIYQIETYRFRVHIIPANPPLIHSGLKWRKRIATNLE